MEGEYRDVGGEYRDVRGEYRGVGGEYRGVGGEYRSYRVLQRSPVQWYTVLVLMG